MTDLAEQTVEQRKEQSKHWDAIWWAGAFIWIGLALGAEYLEILPQVGDTTEWWPWIFIGLGPWSLILNGYRLASDAPNPTTWDWIWTVIFLGVAVGTFVDFGGEILGAAVLIGIGVMILVRALTQRS